MNIHLPHSHELVQLVQLGVGTTTKICTNSINKQNHSFNLHPCKGKSYQFDKSIKFTDKYIKLPHTHPLQGYSHQNELVQVFDTSGICTNCGNWDVKTLYKPLHTCFLLWQLVWQLVATHEATGKWPLHKNGLQSHSIREIRNKNIERKHSYANRH